MGTEASKAKEDLLTVVNKIAAETTPDEQQTATRSRWDFWSTPEADLCVDIGLLKVVLSSTVRTGESVALDPALDVQMHQMSMYATAGPSKDADIHAGNIWLTWTAQFDLLRLLLLPRPASAGLTASPLDVKLGPLTLSTDLSPDAIRDALSRIDRDSYSKMKPHDVLAYLAANTPMRVGGECGGKCIIFLGLRAPLLFPKSLFLLLTFDILSLINAQLTVCYFPRWARLPERYLALKINLISFLHELTTPYFHAPALLLPSRSARTWCGSRSDIYSTCIPQEMYTRAVSARRVRKRQQRKRQILYRA